MAKCQLPQGCFHKERKGTKADIGKFNFGYFTRTGGLLANEEDIKSTLAGVKDVTEAYRRLDDKYDAAFYMRSAERVNYKKLANGFVEKDMAYAPMFGAGQIDERVGQYLRMTDFKSLQGRVLNDETIGDVLKDFDTNGLKQNLFGSKEELSKAIYDEQYAAWDRLKEMFPANMDIGMIANHAINKHGNKMLAFEEAVSSMVEVEKSRGALTNKDALGIVSKNLIGAGVVGIKGADIDEQTGKILIPNQLNGGEDFLSIGKMHQLAKDKYSELLWTDASGQQRFGRKLEYDGRTVGTYTMSPVSEVSDFQGITSSGPLESMKKIVDLRTERSALKAQGKSYEHLDNEIEELKASYSAISRGKKITDREVDLLNLQKYDSGFIDTYNQAIKDKTMTESEVTDILGHVLKKDTNSADGFARENGGFVLDDKVKGRSVLGGYTESLSNRLLYDDTKTDLYGGSKHRDNLFTKEYATDNYDSLIAPEISKFYKNGRDISIEKTEQLYSMAKGMQAIEWNAGSFTNFDRMTGTRGFRNVKLEDVATSVGNDAGFILKNDNNIFNKNLLIDLGEDAGKAYSDRYIALPFAPSKVSGDNVIKLEFQKQINTLIGRKENLSKAMSGEGDSTIEQARASFKESIADFKNVLIENITGKTGVAGQAASVREALSVNGKSSFIMFNDSEKISKNISEDIGKSMKILADENGVAALNDSALSTAMFGKKTLLEHFQAGRSIDARFISEDAFRRMGFFDKDYMQQTLKTDDEDVMRKFLSTHGTMSDTTRYPSIKEGSTKPTLIYLNDKLQGNRTQMTASGALAAVADNDGDLIASSIIRDRGNRDYLAYQAVSGATEDATFWKDIEASVMHRAIGINKYWDNEAYGIMKKDIQRSVDNGDLFTITGSSGVDKKIYAEFGVSPSAQAITDNSSIYKEFQTNFNLSDKKGKEYVDAVDNALNSITNTTERDRYKKAAIFEEAFSNFEVGQIAKVRKLTIGEVNVPLFRLRKAAELAMDPLVEGNTSAQHVIQQTAEVIEQEVISAKKGNVREYVTKANDFSKALNGMLYGNQDSRRQSANEMKDWLKLNAHDELIEEAKKLKTNHYFDAAIEDDEKMFTTMSDTFVSAVSSLNNNQVRAIKEFEKVGTQLRGIGAQKVSNVLQGIPDKNIDFTHRIWNEIADTGILDGARRRTTEEFYSETSESMRKAASQKAILSDSREWLKGESTGQKMKSVLKSTGELFEKISKGFDGKTLAIGALGLAGAYLVAGFVGGNPSRPADTQAMEDSQGYDIPSLTDQDLQNAQSSKQPGYVINVNAKTNQDKQHASQAINNAVSRNYNTNVNISMNITDDNGNINDRYVEQLLAGAIQ
jgi:hypothetical protein